MAYTIQLIFCLGMMALCLANPVNKIRWCVKSEAELKKCIDLSKTCGSDQATLTCVSRSSNEDCIKAIANDDADAVTLDSGEIYKASLLPYGLDPAVAENYGTVTDPETCYYAVALAKESSQLVFGNLKGIRTCHTAVGRAAGWNVPIGTLLATNQIQWDGIDSESLEKAVAKLFVASCVPGAKEPTLCKQCAGKTPNTFCKANDHEGYFGYAGARQCLKDDKGDVAFVKHILPDDFKKGGYKLLCPDNTAKPVDEYKKCFVGQVPSHAVVTANRPEKANPVIEFLMEAQKKAECKLFSSPHGKDLMFKDSATSLIELPKEMDAFLYLGPTFSKASKALDKSLESPSQDTIRWCTQSIEEQNKCDDWSVQSEGKIDCVTASSAEECITKVLKEEADAVTLDGGYLYTAGACGLVPAMQEIYDAESCRQNKAKKGTYRAVAVVKKSNKEITWNNLKNFKSCHTAKGRTAGYNIPVGLIKEQYGTCDLTTFFKESCIPGEDVNSNLCKLCAGNDKNKCLPNNKEPYYGYEGALRCLLEKGDVAFMKETIIDQLLENENSPSWAKGWKKEDLQLLCPNGERKSIDQYENCFLAVVPSHATVTTAGRKEIVVNILKEQQERFGMNAGDNPAFQMFVSVGRTDQLFKDSTKCLSEVTDKTMNDFLGKEYTDAISNLNECGKTGLLAACTFHTCSSKK